MYTYCILERTLQLKRTQETVILCIFARWHYVVYTTLSIIHMYLNGKRYFQDWCKSTLFIIQKCMAFRSLYPSLSLKFLKAKFSFYFSIFLFPFFSNFSNSSTHLSWPNDFRLRVAVRSTFKFDWCPLWYVHSCRWCHVINFRRN